MSEIYFERLLSEVSHLRVQLSGMQGIRDAAAHLSAASPAPIELTVYIEAVESERKPFLLRIEGLFSVCERLSPVRTAVFLMLLLDLKDRNDGGSGCLDPLREMIHAYQQLDPLATSVSGSAPALLRTATHRFSQFLEDSRSFATPLHTLRLNRQHLRLELFECSSQRSAPAVHIAIHSSSDAVRKLIERSFANSPVTKLRRLKTAYLECGEAGHDRFFQEIYDHQQMVESWGTFERLSLQTLPRDLLIRAGVSESRLTQAKILHEGFESGRCRYTEIINTSTLWDMIRCSDAEGFKLYPKDFGTNDVVTHLENVIHLLKTYSRYQIFLTEAPIPIPVVTAQVYQQTLPDCYTIFIPRFTKDSLFKVSSFVVYDINLCQNMVQHVLGALCGLPATIRNREAVIARFTDLLKHLQRKGPLPL